MPDTLTYPTPAASLPDANFLWLDASGNPIDFSSGWTFQMKIGRPPNSAKILVTSGIIGSTSVNGSSNLTVVWPPNALSSLTAGRWYFQITATQTSSGAQRILTGSILFNFNPM